MTEFEINKTVAERFGLTKYLFIANDAEILIWNVPSNEIYNGFISSKGNLFDPCNNVEQAWGIMLEHNICITKCEDVYEAYLNLSIDNNWQSRADNICIHKKPFVSAMLLFLELD